MNRPMIAIYSVKKAGQVFQNQKTQRRKSKTYKTEIDFSGTHKDHVRQPKPQQSAEVFTVIQKKPAQQLYALCQKSYSSADRDAEPLTHIPQMQKARVTALLERYLRKSAGKRKTSRKRIIPLIIKPRTERSTAKFVTVCKIHADVYFPLKR